MLVDKDLNDVLPPYVDRNGVQYPRSIERDFSAAELAARGWFRLNIDPVPDGNRKTGGHTREWRGDPQEAWQIWNSEPIPATRSAVNAVRDGLFRLGTTVDLGGGLVVPVDTRDQEDLTNIQGLTSFGILKTVQQESGTFTFGGADDVEYELTYAQLIEIGLTAMARRDAIWKASRAVKAQIEAGTLTDAADIPAAFDTILSPAP